MGLCLSLILSAWNDIVEHQIFGFEDYKENVIVRSLSFGRRDGEVVLRTFSFKKKALNKSEDSDESAEAVKPKLKRDFPITNLFVKREYNKDIMSLMDNYEKPIHKSRPSLLSVEPFFLSSTPRPISELDAAATKVQKVYKSYRTRRNLADCAVIAEELWWKVLDYAALNRSSVSFFDINKHETAVSRWVRARMRVAKVGKGLLKDEKAQKLALQHWLEAIDPRHRYGHNLHFYYDVWSDSKSSQPFFYWLDVGDGKEVNLESCPRVDLQRQCISYLGPKEREAYEVTVEDGKLVYKQSGQLLNTNEGSKWIFVLSTSRSLYVGQKKKGAFQHSSFLSGGATTAAGRLVAHHGILEAIWPYSGHYLPTEDNFKEFISFLEEHHVDLTKVKRFAVDDDRYSNKDNDQEETKEETSLENLSISATSTDENALNVDGGNQEDDDGMATTKTGGNIQEPKFDPANRLSCKWASGVGPRIGCVRDYPMELQFKALEKVNLSPNNVTQGGPPRSTFPIPSPRPSPRVRMSPRLAYMGLPSPRITAPLQN